MENLIHALKETLVSIREAQRARRSALTKKAMEANQGVAPTIDCNGRLHAPTAGYQWEEDVYGAGEYLSEEFSCKKANNESIRFKVTSDTLKEIKELFDTDPANLEGNYEVSSGKAWSQQGVEVQYAYIKGFTKAQADSVSDLIKSFDKKVKDDAKAKRGTAPVGKVQITGVIVKAYVIASTYSYQTTYTDKIDVQLENGAIVSGTQAKAIIDAEVGDTVVFTATFKQDEEDETVSYYSRPSKAKLLKEKV